MENRVSSIENRREPQRIGEILAELLVLYRFRFPAARIAVVQTPPSGRNSHACFIAQNWRAYRDR